MKSYRQAGDKYCKQTRQRTPRKLSRVNENMLLEITNISKTKQRQQRYKKNICSLVVDECGWYVAERFDSIV